MGGCESPEFPNGYPGQERLTEELSNWLQQYQWDYFLTVTCRWPRRDSIAFIRDIYEILTASETSFWSDPHRFHLPYRAFIACEPHRFSNNLHAHGLVTGFQSIYPPSVFQKALDSRFGRSRVELCRSRGDVAAYCTKYVIKYTDGDNYDFKGYWPAPRVDKTDEM